MNVLLVSDSGRPGPTMSAQRGYLATLINTYNASRLTEAIRKIAGPEYHASECAGVYAIIRVEPGNIRTCTRGECWSDALDKAKARWHWVVMPPKGCNHG